MALPDVLPEPSSVDEHIAPGALEFLVGRAFAPLVGEPLAVPVPGPGVEAREREAGLEPLPEVDDLEVVVEVADERQGGLLDAVTDPAEGQGEAADYENVG